jgi:hypothetical protein
MSSITMASLSPTAPRIAVALAAMVATVIARGCSAGSTAIPASTTPELTAGSMIAIAGKSYTYGGQPVSALVP